MDNVMKQYVYLWINKYLPINDCDEKDGYIFSDIGINLGSKYFFSHVWDGKEFEIKLEKVNNNFEQNSFSDCISDIKAFVGRNGSGKTSLLDFLYRNIGEGFGDVFPNVDYILFFIDENEEIIEDEEDPKNKKIHLHYVSHKAGSFPPARLVENVKHSDNIKIYGEGFVHKADLAVFYSASFSDTEYALSNLNEWGDWKGTRNITTGGLLQTDKKTLIFYGLNTPGKKRFTLDRLSSYYIMEQNRNIDFLLGTDEEFFSFFNIPNALKMSVLTHAYDQIIEDVVKKRKGEENEFFEWRKYYLEIKTFYEQLKFAAFLNFLQYYNLKIPLDLVKLHFKEQQWEKIFNKTHFIKQAVRVFSKIDEIIEIIKRVQRKNKFSTNEIIIDLKRNKQELRKINKLYNEIPKFSPFLLFEFTHRLSSGEESLLKFFSRFYNALKKPENGRPINNVHLFIDEPDLYIHPEWQRKWLSRFIWGIENVESMLRNNIDVSNSFGQNFLKEHEKFRVQVFLTTHSPFIVTDFFTENIVFLNREKDGFGKTLVDQYKKDYTLGADIFDILRSGFFIDSVVGEFAEKRVRDIVEFIEKNPRKKQEEIPYLNQIGDPILKGLLEASIRNKEA